MIKTPPTNDDPNRNSSPKPKLNVFALPSQTTVLATLIICVIYGTLLAIALNPSSLPLWVLVPGLLLLSIRAWLAWPERMITNHELRPAGQDYEKLENHVRELAGQTKLKRVPRLMLARQNMNLEMYGGWRRWGIAIGQQKADSMAIGLEDPAIKPYVDALIIHELHHFRHGDHMWYGYTWALLNTGFKFFGWVAAFSVAWVLILGNLRQDVLNFMPDELALRFAQAAPVQGMEELFRAALPSAEDWQILRHQILITDISLLGGYALANTFPLAIGSALIIFLWFKLLRAREMYADAGVVHQQKTMAYVREAQSKVFVPTGSPMPRQSGRPLLQQLTHSSRATHIASIIQWMKELVVVIRHTFKDYTSPYPVGNQRTHALVNPESIYDGWGRTAWTVGLVVLGFDLLLTGTSALWWVGQWPMHFPVLVTYVLVSLAMIPSLVLARDARSEALKIVSVVMLVRGVALVSTLGLIIVLSIVSPQTLTGLMNASASIISGYSGIESDMPIDVGAFMFEVVIKNVSQLVAAYIITLLAIQLQITVTRRILTWYSFPNADLWLMRLVYATIALAVLVLTCIVLPLVTDLVLWRFDELLHPVRWLIALPIVVTATAGYFWFRRSDHRYAQYCPHCGTSSSQTFKYDQTCNTCLNFLSTWLLCNYSHGRTS